MYKNVLKGSVFGRDNTPWNKKFRLKFTRLAEIGIGLSSH